MSLESVPAKIHHVSHPPLSFRTSLGVIGFILCGFGSLLCDSFLRFAYLLIKVSVISNLAAPIHTVEQSLDKLAFLGPLFLLAGVIFLRFASLKDAGFKSCLTELELPVKDATTAPDENRITNDSAGHNLSSLINFSAKLLPYFLLGLIALIHFAPLLSPNWQSIRADYDEGVHVMAAVLFKQGYIPYRDFFFTQPPMALYVLLPAAWIGGVGPSSLWLARAIVILCGLGASWLLFLIGRKLWNWQLGCVALVIYGFDGIDAFVGHEALLEQVLTGFSLLALWTFLQYLDKHSEKWLILTGCFCAASTLTKLNGLLVLMAILVCCFIWTIMSRFRISTSSLLTRHTQLTSNFKPVRTSIKLLLYFTGWLLLLVLPFVVSSAGNAMLRQVVFFQLLRPDDGIVQSQRFDSYALNPGAFQVGGNAALTITLAGLGLLGWCLKLTSGNRNLKANNNLPLSLHIRLGLIILSVWMGLEIAFITFSGSFFVHYYLTLLPLLSLAGSGVVFLTELGFSTHVNTNTENEKAASKSIIAKSTYLSFLLKRDRNINIRNLLLKTVILLILLLIVLPAMISNAITQASTLFGYGESAGPETIAKFLQTTVPASENVQSFDMLENLLASRRLSSISIAGNNAKVSGSEDFDFMIDSYGALLYQSEGLDQPSLLTLFKTVLNGSKSKKNPNDTYAKSINSASTQSYLENVLGNAGYVVLDERGQGYVGGVLQKTLADSSVLLLDEPKIMKVYANQERGALLNAQEWITSHLPFDSKIWIEPASLNVVGKYQLVAGPNTFPNNQAWFAGQKIDYLILSSNNYAKFCADKSAYSSELQYYQNLIDSSANSAFPTSKDLATFGGNTNLNNSQPRPFECEPGRLDIIAINPANQLSSPVEENQTKLQFQYKASVIELESYNLQRQVTPGDTLALSFKWQLASNSDSPALPEDTTLFIHLLNTNGQTVAQRDNLLGSNNYLVHEWFPYQNVVTASDLLIPLNLPTGQYQVELGIYFSNSGERLVSPLTHKDSQILETLQVK